jgi:hypothetical protein
MFIFNENGLNMKKLPLLLPLLLSGCSVGAPEGVTPVSGFELERLKARAAELGFDMAALIYPETAEVK